MNVLQILNEETYLEKTYLFNKLYKEFVNSSTSSFDITKNLKSKIPVIVNFLNYETKNDKFGNTEFKRNGDKIIINIYNCRDRDKNDIRETFQHELIHVQDLLRSKNLNFKKSVSDYSETISGYYNDVYEFNALINYIKQTSKTNKKFNIALNNVKNENDLKIVFKDFFQENFYKLIIENKEFFKKILKRLIRENVILKKE